MGVKIAAVVVGVLIMVRVLSRTTLAAGVKIDGLSPNGLRILGTIERAARTLSIDLVVTSGWRDDPDSMHGRGDAIDVRTVTLTPDTIRTLYYWLKAELPGFTVLYEVTPGASVPAALVPIVYRNANATGPHLHIAAPKDR